MRVKVRVIRCACYKVYVFDRVLRRPALRHSCVPTAKVWVLEPGASTIEYEEEKQECERMESLGRWSW